LRFQGRTLEGLDFSAASLESARLVGCSIRDCVFEVGSAWDLVNTSTPYPAALPILLEHLDRPYPDRVREGIARALAVRDAKFGWETLVRIYREEPSGSDAKDGLAVALAAVADDDVVEELISLARDPAHGESRILLLRGLKRSRAPQARAALEELSAEPMVGREARALLGGR
jgi:HEAT repeat protein